MLCKNTLATVSDEFFGFAVDISAAGITHLNSCTESYVDFCGNIFIGITGFIRELNFRKVSVLCFDIKDFPLQWPMCEFEYEAPNISKAEYRCQMFSASVRQQFHISGSPYKLLLSLDHKEVDSWFFRVCSGYECCR